MLDTETKMWSPVHDRGGHYNIFRMEPGINGIDALKEIFPEGEANDMNFVMFSTSGIHGTHFDLDDIEESLKKYGDEPDFLRNVDKDDTDVPDDYIRNYLTILVIHPRLVQLKYGVIEVILEDIPYLRKLAKSSVEVFEATQKCNV